MDDAEFATRLPELRDRLRSRHPSLIGIWLFGSRAKGTAGADCDIDLGVLGCGLLEPVAVFDTQLELGAAVNADVDLIDLRRAPTVLRKEAVCSGKLIWTSDDDACAVFASDAVFAYVASRDELLLAARETDGAEP